MIEMEFNNRTSSTGNDFTGTYFNIVCGKVSGRPMTLAEFTKIVKSDEFADKTRQYRILKASNKDEAVKIKALLPGWVPAGLCLAGRKKDNLTEHSGLGMYDVDGVNPEWSASFRNILREYLFIAGANQTVGGGLRIFVNMGEVMADHWAIRYQEVARFLTRLFKKELDGACKDITRCTFFSHDPDAWCRSREETQPFPYGNWEHLLPDEDANPPCVQPAPNDDIDPIITNHAGQPSAAQQLTMTAGKQGAGVPAPASARLFTDEGLNMLLQESVSEEFPGNGNRHKAFLHLGFVAKKHSCTPADLDRLAQLAAQMYSAGEYDYREIHRNMQSAYDNTLSRSQYISKKTCELVTKVPIGDVTNTKDSRSLQNPLSRGAGYRLTEMKYHYFSEKRRILFPPIIQDILNLCDRPVQKDILAMSLLTAFSALLAKVRFYYKQSVHSANLFLMIVGASGTYKSYADKSRHMLRDVFAKYDEINRQRLMEFNKAQYRWEMEKKNANKEKREPNYKLLPAKTPRLIQFNCPDTISKSQFMHNFNNSQETGMIVYNTELGSIIESMGAECGNYGADLRKVAMNEPIGQHYRTDIEALIVRFPMLSFISATTPDVLMDFMPDTDSGIHPRWYYIHTEETGEFDPWIEDNNDHESDIIKALEALAPMALGLHEFFLQYPFEMRLTKNQKERFNRFFSRKMEGLAFEQMPGYSSVVVRTPIILLRICCVLTSLRKYKDANTDSIAYCHDDDFNTALAIVDVGMEHSLAVITMMPKNTKKVRAKEVECPHRILDILKELPDDFSTAEFVQIANLMYNISECTARKSLRTQVKKRYLEDVSRGKYRKTDKLKTYMEEVRKYYTSEE